MILDAQNLLSDAQAITATAASTNYIDLGAVGSDVNGNQLTRDLGKGTPVPLLIQVLTAFTASGSATLTITLEVDDNTSFSSAKTVYTSGAVAKATLVAGYRLPIRYVPKGADERYLRLNYTVATGPMTAGTITAGITGGDADVPA
jgi:hypothetical protein